MNPSRPVTRRAFLKSGVLASAAAVTFPHVLRAQTGGQSPNNKLNIACVGVGGRGRAAVAALKDEHFVAFSDVDEVRAAKTFQEFPDVPRFRDYREMFDQLADRIDAVTVSIPDHMHYAVAMTALAYGKHLFVEKPLTHSVAEERHLTEFAREKGVATQMGNQGHASDGMRVLREWYDAGVLGDVTEVQSWTNRPIWPQGVKTPDHSKFIPVVPDTLDWNVWLGVAAERPYDPAYLPFTWRGYWDFGSGALGDMGCHLMDGAYWALGLGPPTTIEAISAKETTVSGPTASVITYHFAAHGGRPAVRWTWYDGGMQPMPPEDLEADRKLPENGTLIVGRKATVLASTYYGSVRIIPEAKMQALIPTLPPKTLPRVKGGHFAEWVRACKGGPPAGSNFNWSSKITELCILGNVAVRIRRPLVWDAAAMRFPNRPAADRLLTTTHRLGFGV